MNVSRRWLPSRRPRILLPICPRGMGVGGLGILGCPYKIELLINNRWVNFKKESKFLVHLVFENIRTSFQQRKQMGPEFGVEVTCFGDLFGLGCTCRDLRWLGTSTLRGARRMKMQRAPGVGSAGLALLRQQTPHQQPLIVFLLHQPVSELLTKRKNGDYSYIVLVWLFPRRRELNPSRRKRQMRWATVQGSWKKEYSRGEIFRIISFFSCCSVSPY